MKAYSAWDDKAYENYCTIVFAENAKQAKKIAFASEICENAEYIDVRVKRLPEADKLYKGRDEIDWCDPETRLALVKELEWACLDTSGDCDTCPAKEYCSHWKEETE